MTTESPLPAPLAAAKADQPSGIDWDAKIAKHAEYDAALSKLSATSLKEYSRNRNVTLSLLGVAGLSALLGLASLGSSVYRMARNPYEQGAAQALQVEKDLTSKFIKISALKDDITYVDVRLGEQAKSGSNSYLVGEEYSAVSKNLNSLASKLDSSLLQTKLDITNNRKQNPIMAQRDEYNGKINNLHNNALIAFGFTAIGFFFSAIGLAIYQDTRTHRKFNKEIARVEAEYTKKVILT
ncbi:MAG: hypothetical protein WCK90_04140 [archaeon]